MSHLNPAQYVWKNPWHFLAFGFGLGTLPLIPGTWGTLGGVLFYWLLSGLPLKFYVLVVLSGSIAGCWICEKVSKDIGQYDYSGVVFDEIAGYCITMTAVPASLFNLCAGFILFRIFDIIKPWPIRWIDEHIKNGFGMMFDDVLAGILACAVLQLFIQVEWFLIG